MIFTDEQKKEILLEIGNAMAARAMQLAPTDLGLLKNSIKAKIIDEKTVEIGCYVEYAEDMEYGTPPEPLDAAEKEDLRQWSKRHGMFAPAVIKKIEKEGIKVGTVERPLKTKGGSYRPFMRPAIFQTLNKLDPVIVKALNE